MYHLCVYWNQLLLRTPERLSRADNEPVCRIAKGCAQEYFGIKPDLTTLGKIIGGGLPVGAYGGRREIMQHVAPAGTMYQVPCSSA